MTPIQQLMLGVGAKKKTYMDDVFSTYLWEGNATTRDINNGIDLAGEGGLLWIKNRESAGQNHLLFDTTAPPQSSGNLYSYPLLTNSTAARGPSGNSLKSFNSNGFSVYTDSGVNQNNKGIASWTFRKAPGFFDVVTYTGTGTKRTVSHNLGCQPGMIIIKRTDAGSTSWDVWHKSLGVNSSNASNFNYLQLNSTNAASDTSRFGIPGTDDPTSTTFTVKNQTEVNASGGEYIAYVFAGGYSGISDGSVEFDGAGDYLTCGSSSDFTFGTGDFTVEGWFKINATWDHNVGIFQISDTAGGLKQSTNDVISFAHNGSSWHVSGGGGSHNYAQRKIRNKWYHFAYVRNSGVAKVYVDGVQTHSFNDTLNYATTYIAIGGYYSTGYLLNGTISNFRVVKGTAVYTSNFNPTDSFTNITNTKLLCCNKASVTGNTVAPTSISAIGNPATSYEYPGFTDLASNIFGDNEDQNVIKCGSYVGNGSSTGPEIYLGWEPQWIMWRNTSAGRWFMFDSMRGIATDGHDGKLHAEDDSAEYYYSDGLYVDLTPTGFKIAGTTHGNSNSNGEKYIYMALRRSDPSVQKLAKLGTDVFAMAAGGISSSGGPGCFIAGFPVDFATLRTTNTHHWQTGARLKGDHYMPGLNLTNSEADASNFTWDSNTGYMTGNFLGYNAWMWKRHAGFDVVTYVGNGLADTDIPHSLNRIPEMIWVKRRDSARTWGVYHKGANGGTNPEQYALYLDTTQAAGTSSQWNNQAPTSTHFSIGGSNTTNNNSGKYIAMLFASVSGISKVGYYDGSASNLTITTGFQPRFVIVKKANEADPWLVLDTTRGWGSGADNYLQLNSNAAQAATDLGSPTSTGFIVGDDGAINSNGKKYIYYAHA